MLTYQAKKHAYSPSLDEKPWLLLLLVFAWLWPGIFSHDLWNPTEPKFYASVEHMIQYGQWALPQAVGQWQLDVSPLYIWLGAASKLLFSPWLTDAFSAVRMVSALFMVLGLLAAGITGKELLGRYQGRSVVLILIGSIGLVMPAHRMDSIPLIFTAMSLLLCGLVFLQNKKHWSLLILTSAYVLSFYSGFLLLLSIALIISIAVVSQTPWRSRASVITIVLAIILSLPLCLIWPYALYKTNVAAFDTWWKFHSFADFGGVGSIKLSFSLFYYLDNIAWYALPAWPLAVWAAVKHKKTEAKIWKFNLTIFAIGLIVLAAMPNRYTENTILILLPLAILGASQLDSLRRGPAAFLNWFGMMTFGLLAIFIWLGFIAMNLGWPEKLSERAAYFSPYYQVDWDWFPIVVAICFSPLWLWAVTRKRIKGRQAVTNWAAGVTLVWSLLMTLFLPWLDAAKSYRPVVEHMEQSLPNQLLTQIQQQQVCIGVDNKDINIILPWQTYGKLPLKTQDYTQCEYRLIVGKDIIHEWQDKLNWEIVWQGARAREKNEWFALAKYVK